MARYRLSLCVSACVYVRVYACVYIYISAKISSFTGQILRLVSPDARMPFVSRVLFYANSPNAEGYEDFSGDKPTMK